MKRNLLILGCATLLALGLSLVSYAGAAPDADGDGVPDQYDNCDATPNGPLAATGGCNGQEDGDLDGYGNPCDADLNNNNSVDAADLGALLTAYGTPSATADLNCNGSVDASDLGNLLSNYGAPPGTSGLSCAGTIPCVAQ